ncbi:hypothetical protein EPT61_03190 [Pediococcus pentosaceus]|uniref:hypothetical protein n=1 Tax=Pediococcus pentosaceus TaxID=1255 RepID=UPI0010087691|nr:hypothetical protein [Pediococcus pentosaceus]RXI21932.1 hypothetical protein EPT61_03190 [Pediococcus pentosaceus]
MRYFDENGDEYVKVSRNYEGYCIGVLLVIIFAIFALPVVIAWKFLISKNNTYLRASLSGFKRWVLVLWTTFIYIQMVKPIYQYLFESGGIQTFIPDSMANYEVYQASVVALTLLGMSTIILKVKRLNVWSGTVTVQSESRTRAIGVAMFFLVGTMLSLCYLMTRISLIIMFLSYFIIKSFYKIK